MQSLNKIGRLVFEKNVEQIFKFFQKETDNYKVMIDKFTKGDGQR